MFEKQYGHVTIRETEVPKRGRCLQATRTDIDFSVYMDIIGITIPDGVNCYAFGNKLIFVTRWSDFSEDEAETVMEESIALGVLPGRLANHFVIKYGDLPWGDVFAIHGIIPGMNEPDAPVDEAIFLFYDKHSGDFIGERSVRLPEQLQNIFAYGNRRALATYQNQPQNLLTTFHQLVYGSESTKNLTAQLLETESQDWCDILYDESHAAVEPEAKNVRTWEPEELVTEFKGLILVEIEGNEVVYVNQNK